MFWLITSLFFCNFSVIRPLCNTCYKEFCCVLLILTVVLTTRWFSIPKLFSHNRLLEFWLLSIGLLLMAASLEVLLVKPDIEHKVLFTQTTQIYLLYILGLVFIRDSCFFAWFLVFRLYILQKESFKAKRRASVLEHQSIQFSLPNHTEASIPLNIILYIQESNHTTQVHCTDGGTITVTDTLSDCIEMIPATLWTYDGSDKIVFHQHLSCSFQTQPKPEIQEIKTITLLNKRQFQIFDIIRQNPGCNTTFIAEKVSKKITIRTIERNIAELRNKKVINHEGSKKGGGYHVCQNNVVQSD